MAMDNVPDVRDLGRACTYEEIYKEASQTGVRSFIAGSCVFVVGENCLQVPGRTMKARLRQWSSTCPPLQPCRDGWGVNFLSALQRLGWGSCLHIYDLSGPGTGHDGMYSILGCFTTPSFATSARTASKRLKAHGCSAVLSLIPGKIPIIHWPTSTTGGSKAMFNEVLRGCTLDVQGMPDRHPEVRLAPVGVGYERGTKRLQHFLNALAAIPYMNSAGIARIMYLETQSQLVELLMQPLLCHTLHSWVLSPAAREREEALALGRQHLAQNQEAFDVAELAHMRRCAHRERTQGALEQCQTTAALRQQYQSKVSRILFTEARVAELRQEAAVRGPQRHKERQHEADQVANNVSTQVAPIERQQHRLEADIKKAQQKRRDLRQRQASKAQAVDEDETCMQEGRLEVGHLDERIDEEQQMLKRAKRRQQAAQAEIVRRIPNHD